MRGFEHKLRCTHDYSLFVTNEMNRDVRRLQYLRDSMRAYGYDPGFPLRCVRRTDGKLKITHGNHRFHIARELDLPVWFVEVDREIPLYDSEAAGRAWSVEDFTVARARGGDHNAQAVLEYREETGIGLGACISLVGGEGATSHNRPKQMVRGTFRIGDRAHAEEIKSLVQKLHAAGVAFASSTPLVGALSKLLFVPEFEPKRLLARVADYPHVMKKQGTVDQYLELCETVYNWHVPAGNRINIAFRARQIAKQRSTSFGRCDVEGEAPQP